MWSLDVELEGWYDTNSGVKRRIDTPLSAQGVTVHKSPTTGKYSTMLNNSFGRKQFDTLEEAKKDARNRLKKRLKGFVRS